jgi:DNA-binding transcriptional MerR regulator
MNWEKNTRTLQVPTKRYRIGELVRHSPFSRQTIHNYTIMGLIREAEWTEGGHRLYDESVFERLARIIELRETMSLTEVRRVLNREEAVAHADPSAATGLSRLPDSQFRAGGGTPPAPGEDSVGETT